MKIVSILAVRDEPEVVDAHLAFHLNVGVDFTIATDYGSRDGTVEVLESYVRGGCVWRVTERGDLSELEWRTAMARHAATDLAADWVISTDADEFWWPRGESLKDALTAIPPRYGIVQGLVRIFPPWGFEEEFFAERMTVRPSLLRPGEDTPEPLRWALRPLYRADPGVLVDPENGTERGRRVPLRAWYPVEVLRFPLRSVEQAERRCALGLGPRSTIEADALDAYQSGRLGEWYEGLAAGGAHFVEDERLRNVLRAVRKDQASSGRRFALPAETRDPLLLRRPDIVDDAAYAVECAAVGEVDLSHLDEHIRELEDRIGVLEARFWPRVARTLSRVVRR